ncbi:MAG: hypothetical protein KBF99_05155 [Leptospiraceae bacterium]|nr:hypothetical protein [Leptospiraceae bacterium]
MIDAIISLITATFEITMKMMMNSFLVRRNESIKSILFTKDSFLIYQSVEKK